LRCESIKKRDARGHQQGRHQNAGAQPESGRDAAMPALGRVIPNHCEPTVRNQSATASQSIPPIYGENSAAKYGECQFAHSRQGSKTSIWSHMAFADEATDPPSPYRGMISQRSADVSESDVRQASAGQ
jgi:hypothetical protein